MTVAGQIKPTDKAIKAYFAMHQRKKFEQQHRETPMEEHAVIAKFDYAGSSPDALLEVEEELEAAINAAGVGEFDGNEIAVDLSDGSLYMYGPDAEALFAVIRPILARAECLRNTRVILRFGPPEDGVPERTEVL